MGQDCIFCRIIEGQIPSAKVYEDEAFVCIRDIQPQAKTHLLVVPKRHVASLDAAFPEGGKPEVELIGRLMETGARIARQQGLVAQGYRAVINTGSHAGQTVFHIHLHLLGGEPLRAGFA